MKVKFESPPVDADFPTKRCILGMDIYCPKTQLGNNGGEK